MSEARALTASSDPLWADLSRIFRVVIDTKRMRGIQPISDPSVLPPRTFKDAYGNMWFFEKTKHSPSGNVYCYRKQAFMDDKLKIVECAYCGMHNSLKNMTKDHAEPRSRGFSLSKENTVYCCYSCNARKGCRNLGEWILDEYSKNYDSYLFLRSRIDKMIRESPWIDSTSYNKAIAFIDARVFY